MNYFVVMCPKCGQWRSCEVSDILKFRFRCFSCGKTRKLHDARRGGLTLLSKGPYSSGTEAQIIVQALGGSRA